MADQLELLETFTAREIAAQLQDALETEEDDMAVLTAFHLAMSRFPTRSYRHLEVVGMGNLHEVFIWEVPDKSFLLVGWVDEDEIAVGVLPPGSTFTPVPHENGVPHSLH